MSARSKIVRDFSGQEVAIPYDPRDDAQHTPGPWEFSDSGEEQEIWSRDMCDHGHDHGRMIAKRKADTPPQVRANWQLLAAAPALLEALRGCLDLLEANESDDEWAREFVKPRADAARAAIAAAERPG